MLSLPATTRVFLATAHVDFRKGFDGLCAIVRDGFGADPLSGDLFLFFNRRHDRAKILVWDRHGFVIYYKRLERGTFTRDFHSGEDGTHVEIDRTKLQLILDGVEISRLRYRKHFADPITLSKRNDERATSRDPRRPGDAESGATGTRARAHCA